MKKSYSRRERVSDLVQTALAEILQREAEGLNLGIVTVTDVNVAHDMSYAKIFVSVLEEKRANEVIKELNNEAKNFRYQLAQAVKLRIIPQLKFIYDDSSLRGNRISSLINDSLKDDKPTDND